MFWPNRKKIIRLAAVLATILFLGAIQGDTDIYFRISKSIDLFGRVYKEIAINYVDDVEPEEFMLSGISGMLSSLDPYTVYIDEGKQKDIELFTLGKYGGIGVTVGLKDGRIIVVDLLEGYSAQRQGMRIGDEVIEIDGDLVGEDNYDDLSLYMKGDPGTVVAVKVNRPGISDPITFHIVREEIIIKNLTHYGFIPKNSNNAYLKLSSFTRSAGEEIKNALYDLAGQKEIKSIVLDLRGNPGGLLDAAIDVSEKFLKKGDAIVSVIGRDTIDVSKYYSKEEPVAGSTPLVVLVDGGSASASEIVAGAIQDQDRGVIVGSPSFGKGLVQTVVPLSHNTSLKITTGKYYTPSGRCIQKIDYTKNNKVFSTTLATDTIKYQTKNKRPVFSRGGILPDSTIENNFESKQIVDLVAKGMFFKFTTFYFNSHPELKFDKLSDNGLINEFKAFLEKEKYNYVSRCDNLLKELRTEFKNEKYNGEISSRIDSLEQALCSVKNKEIEFYKNEILNEIKIELMARFNGRKGRIIESLKNDKQFDAAIALLNNSKTYARLLGNKSL